MSNLAVINQNQEVQKSNPMSLTPTLASTQVSQAREIEEVKLRYMMAAQFPRNLLSVSQNISFECRDYDLAEAAEYSFKRGVAIVTGPSIKLMEAIAKHYGNIDTGIRVLERRTGSSTIEVYALDIQSNTRKAMTFDVKHSRDTKQGQKQLTDERDIYEMEANMASRRLRRCIEGIIPKAIVNDAIKVCRETLDGGSKETRAMKLTKLLMAFSSYGISQENIEKSLGKKMDEFLPEDIATCRGFYTAIKDGQQSVEEIFPELKNDFPKSEELKANETDKG